MKHASRRQFLASAGRALGGLALVHSVPGWAFATRNPASDLVHRSSSAMGTSIRLSLLKDEFSTSASNGAFLRLQEVDRLLTVHHAESDLMRVNSGAHVSGKEISDVARAAIHMGQLSEGAMDVTVLPAMRRLGFVPGTEHEGLIDFEQIQVNGSTVSMRRPGLGADFGGIAKGYGVDQAIEAARSSGVSAALVDAGGDLYALGRPDADRPWKIGIRHPERDQDLVATLEIENEAVATSGTYLQTRMVDGRKVSHIVDPRTGQPVEHVVSATIVARDTMTADALATAVSVTSRSHGQSLIASQSGVEGFLIYADGSFFVSQGLKKRLQLL